MFWVGTAAVVAVVLGGARLYDRKRKNHLATRTGEKETGGYDAISFTSQSPGSGLGGGGAGGAI